MKQIAGKIATCPFESRSRMGLLDTLISEHIKDPTKFTEDDVTAHVNTFLFNGHNSTGWAATFATYLLGLHHDVQTKVQEELDRVLKGKDDTFTKEDLRELVYLECVIKETHRIYPFAPMFAREAEETVNICGYDVAAGANILIPTFHIHTDPRHWPDPEIFDPDRFTPANSASRHRFAFFPFSAGPRGCIGQKLGMQVEKAMLAALFRNFSVESLTPRREMRTTIGISLKFDGPVRVRLTPRNVV